MREPVQPPSPPAEKFPPLVANNYIMMTTMASTAVPPCRLWSNRRDPQFRQQPHTVLDEPYKKAFEFDVGQSFGQEAHSGKKGHGRGGGRGSTSPPRSVAWRQATSASRIRRPGTSDRGREIEFDRPQGAGIDYSRARTSPAAGQGRVSPPLPPRGTGPSMGFSLGGSMSIPVCRLRL